MTQNCFQLYILSILFLFSFLRIGTAQNQTLEIQPLSVEHGLSNRFVNNIFQDSRGVVWILTNYGLNRWDGTEFKTYFKETHGFQSNQFQFAHEDKFGNLWLISFDKLGKKNKLPVLSVDIFNPITEEVYSFNEMFAQDCSFKEANIIHIGVFDNGDFWITTKNDEVFRYTGQFEKMPQAWQDRVKNEFLEIEGIYRVELTFFEQTSADNYWYSYKNHLFQIDSLGQEINSDSVAGGFIILKTGKLNDESIFVAGYNATSYTSLWIYIGKEGEDLQSFQVLQNRSYMELASEVSISPDDDGKLWIANSSRLLQVDMETYEVTDFSAIWEKEVNYPIRSLTVDKDGLVWANTRNGLYVLELKTNFFTKLLYNYERALSTRGIAKIEDKLYVSAYEKGILEVDLANRESKKVNLPSNLNNLYMDLEFGDESLLWVGMSHSKLMLYNQKEEQLEGLFFYNIDKPAEFQAKESQVLFQDKEANQLWIGSNSGLLWLDTLQNKIVDFEQYNDFTSLASEQIRYFHQNKRGIWIATDNGIYLLEKNKGITAHFNTNTESLPCDIVYFIHEDKEGVFWLATKGCGLIEWSPKGKTINHFTTKDGLSHNVIYAVYEDDHGFLWLPSDMGIMRFDKNNFSINIFLPDDGITHEEFNWLSNYQAEDGTLYFGGLNGVTAFHPNDFIEESYSKNPPMLLTNLQIYSDKENSLLDYTIDFNQNPEIKIHPTHRFFEVEFKLLDYRKTAKRQYAWMIEGYDKNWNYTKHTDLRIGRLPYGTYTLKIKGQSVLGKWSDNELEIPLTYRKPFYLEWWFIGLMVISVILVLFYAVRFRTRKLIKDRERLEDEVKKRTQKIEKDKAVIEAQAAALKELDISKTRFFSNITHEFRTPLTLIIGPLEKITKEQALQNIFKTRLNGVLKNAKHLLTLINQMLDLSKIESKRMQVEVIRGDIIGYTQELVNRFQSLALEKGQELTFMSNLNSWDTHFDKEKWDKIIYNLLSNALKFTSKGKAIQLSLVKIQKGGRETIRLDIKDSGIGIEKDQIKHIFNRFYQVDNSMTRTREGTGIGLALVKELVELQGGEIWVSSEVNKGTSFEIHIPVLEREGSKLLSEDSNIQPFFSQEIVEEKPITALSASNLNHGEKLELLIVDDNQEIREYIRYCIDATKYNITEASDGEEGIQKAQTLIPDLIISDVMMPKKNGFQVTQAIRNHINTSHIPLILLTAKASLESRLEGLERGADAYLTKPFSPQELVLRIQKLIEIRQLLQERYEKNAPSEENEIYQQEDIFITNLREYILQNVENLDLNGERVGKHFGMSRIQLYRKLKALTNQSISEFIRSVRLQKALELIQKSQFNISEISYQTGFASVSYFSRAFKKEFGKTPSKM